MIIEICLIIIASMLVLLVSAILFALIKSLKSMSERGNDLHNIATSTNVLIENCKEVSEIAKEKIGKLKNFSSYFRLWRQKSTPGSSSPQEKNSSETILQAVKWIALSAALIKLTKKGLNKNEK